MIRKASEKDFESIYGLLEELFDQDTLKKEQIYDIFLEQLKSKNHLQFVLIEKGLVIGFAGVSIRHNIQSSGRIAELEELIITKAWQGIGHGKSLLSYAEEEARKQGCKELRLISSFRRTKAHEFYEQRGYTKASFFFWKTLQTKQ